MVKRAFDIAGAGLGLLVLGIPLLLIGLWVRLDSPGPALFRQKRVGKGGKQFWVLKFRTMYVNAQGPALPENTTQLGGFVFSPPGPDKRVTRAGRWLRKTSVDELPQLVNVVRGEMGLVGPRPEIPEIVAQYPPTYHRRHDVLPGLTGLAQIHGRSDLTYSEIMAYDLAYVDKHPFLQDLAILARTALVVLLGKGAR